MSFSSNVTILPTPNGENTDSTLFFWVITIVAVMSIFYNNLPSYVEGIALSSLKVGPRKASYGEQRIFGEIGRFVGVYVTGFLVNQYQIPGLSKYSFAFFLYMPMVLLLLPLGCYLYVFSTTSMSVFKDKMLMMPLPLCQNMTLSPLI